MSEDTSAQSTSDDSAAEEEEAQPMNRAERRAKGKKGGQPAQAGGKAKFTPKNAQGHGPRLWANRRAG
jgi:hypothetical protein